MNHSDTSQEARILKYLLSGGKLTPQSALRRFSCMRLASRCHRLISEGHDIKSQWYRVSGSKQVKQYYIDAI